MAKTVLGGGEQMSLSDIQDRISGTVPTAGRAEIEGQVVQATRAGREEAATEAAVAPKTPSASLTPLLTPREDRDVAMAFEGWFRGEMLRGGSMPDVETQEMVRRGLVGSAFARRPGGATQFEKFLAIGP